MNIFKGDFQFKKLSMPLVVKYNYQRNYRNQGIYEYFQWRFSSQKTFSTASCSQIQLSVKLQKLN